MRYGVQVAYRLPGRAGRRMSVLAEPGPLSWEDATTYAHGAVTGVESRGATVVRVVLTPAADR